MKETRQEKFHRLRKEQGLCRRCGEKNDTSDICCSKCKQKIKEHKKRRELALKKAKLCTRCGSIIDTTGTQCNACLVTRRKRNLALKRKVLNAYGGVCTCCGDDFIGRLTIDHINNDGAEHRTTIKSSGLYHYLVVHNFPPGFQVLCASCNFSKFTMGYCPHKEKGESYERADECQQPRCRNQHPVHPLK